MPGAGLSSIQTEHMPGDRAQSLASGHLALDVGHHGQGHGVAFRRRASEQVRTGFRQDPWIVIRLPADHHAVHMFQVSFALRHAAHAPVQDHDQVRTLGFQPVDVVTGMRGGGLVEILDGIRSGDRVVTSGQFLIDSESSLQASFLRMAEAAPPEGTEERQTGSPE